MKHVTLRKRRPLLWKQRAAGCREPDKLILDMYIRETTKEHYAFYWMQKDKAARKYVPMTYVFARSSDCRRERVRE